MANLVRTGVSLESDLLEKFDSVIAAKGYTNRSEAIRDLIRDFLVVDDTAHNRLVVATLTMIYDHHRPKLADSLIEMQHHAHGKVLAATHVHLDHRNCLEVIIMKGRSADIKQLAETMLSTRGVQHGKLVITSNSTRPRQ
jgi:CopG family nickel-responsive transcriptional regulator